MKVRWTDKAKDHLRGIWDYIASDSPKYADRMIDRITRKGDSLRRFPMSGHAVPEYEDPAIRQILEGSYRIIYRVGEAGVEILRTRRPAIAAARCY
jgi:plasmid stabilization system protein ParE